MHIERWQLVYFACLIPAIILHEISHGVVALFFGDDTAKRAGRLTLNPIPHIDPFGSIILPALGVLVGLGAFGWAKPVPVNPAKLRKPRAQMVWVSLAGPGTNFLLMIVSALAARAVAANHPIFDRDPFSNTSGLVVQFLFFFAFANLVLGLFNLLPIPPLDGSTLIERVLPADWLPRWYRFRPYGILVLFVLVFTTGIVGRILEPFINSLYRFVLGV
ncbi:MAG: Zn-dependent protease [Actinomycetia bacterium]|nr:Zn-dependent protease [Actinomycetes bacterium]